MPLDRTTPRATSRTTTSYAVLGLLSLRPWTTYELAKQVRRSLNWFWPRAERKLYDEPRRLVADGLATAEEGFTGKRRRTTYAITDDGRAALAAWLDDPPAPRSHESEGMVKVFFADGGDLDQLRVTLDRLEAEALERLTALAELAAEMEGPFPERRHLGALCLRLQHDQERAVLAWTRWARDQVGTWRSTTDPGSWDTRAVLATMTEAPR
jgi:PadR family transcriptional regulator AphA